MNNMIGAHKLGYIESRSIPGLKLVGFVDNFGLTEINLFNDFLNKTKGINKENELLNQHVFKKKEDNLNQLIIKNEVEGFEFNMEHRNEFYKKAGAFIGELYKGRELETNAFFYLKL